MPWSNILGHDAWIDAFRAVRSRGRMAHAYLFVGPEGIGKRSFALELAKATLCEDPPAEPTLTACDRCAACKLVDAGTHPDLFQIAKPEDDNKFPIEVMRAFFEKFGLKPARGHGKVAIIDDVDVFSVETANCSLKALEEPPAGSLLILVGTSLDRQLPTIRSRCQTIRFAPLATALVQKVVEREPLEEMSLLPRAVRVAEGSPGMARRLAEPELWAFRDRLLAALGRKTFDSAELGKDFAKFAEGAGKEGVLQRDRARLTLKLLMTAFRDAIRTGIDGTVPASSVEDAHLLKALAERADPEKWLAILDRCLEAEIHLDRYLSIGLILEGLLDAIGQILEK